ncbi:hypothetical protein P3W85_42840 [Cupriavidus basilensis]|uniref:Uncharacterized protein n=1 Tax=Cupriavidus basilensis TaxID=68895 RepID=A0ABT6B420_9BURK|nr:hypothetical protein [Cupriavidus basilensis]MDF3839630.1 hypothetical protein [Cupriavidus basilensis]
MRDLTQAQAMSAVEAALRKVHPPVSADDVQAVVALLVGMGTMARRLENDMQDCAAADTERGDGA